jgi:hypothetical protein
VVLTGSPPLCDFPGAFRILPGLQYEALRPVNHTCGTGDTDVCRRPGALGGKPDVWHVHNHSLGKSLVLPGALSVLARQGRRLLLHIHDFAEDGRPGNFRVMLAEMARGDRQALFRLCSTPAPTISIMRCSMSAITGFCKLPAWIGSICICCPTPSTWGLSGRKNLKRSHSATPLWLYPTRAIRRKNLGEFLLWSALAPEEIGLRHLGTGKSWEWPRYARWKEVAAELDLPVQFEAVGPAGPSFV